MHDETQVIPTEETTVSAPQESQPVQPVAAPEPVVVPAPELPKPEKPVSIETREVNGREAHVYLTPLKKEVVVKSFITGQEKRFMRRSYSKSLRRDGKDAEYLEVDSLSDVEDLLIQTVVLSYEGANGPDEVLEKVLGAPSQETKFIINLATELSKDDPKS